jgi:putative ABC transport system ATP-binding protein
MRYFEHLQSLPMAFFQQHHIGTISARVVTDAVSVAESLNSFLVNFLQLPFILVTTAALCLMVSPQLSFVVFCGFPVIVYPVIYLAKHIKRVARKLQKNQESFTTVLVDFLAGVQTVKMFAMEDFSLTKYREQNEHMATLEKAVARYDVASRPIIHSVGMLFIAVTMLYGLYYLQLGIAELFFFCGLLYVFYEPIKRFAEHNNIIQKGVAAAERMDDVLQLDPLIVDREDAVEMENFREAIVFDDVWFKYDDDSKADDTDDTDAATEAGNDWILKGVSFTVNRGEKVAIVGPTGAGKSTIVQLLPRLYEIQKGAITIDGRSISDYTCRSVRESISFVPQKPFLFLDTISENIAFGRGFSKEAIRQAASRAHASEFIEKMENGYDTILAEAGKNLSGGQQQRLAIARALVKDAPILVMDEATSALDNVSERYIREAMHDLKGSLTQIVIAHRLSTILDADKIIYLEEGRVIGMGTKEELLESCPEFKLMWQLREGKEE